MKRTIKFRRRTLYNAVNARRKKLGISWREVGRQCDVYDMVIHRIKNGQGPTMETYAKLVVWLGKSPNTFFTPARKRA